MTLRKATFDITAGAEGRGTDDVHLPPSINTRHARLVLVALASDEDNDGTPEVTVTLNELEDVSAADWNDSTEDYALSRQVFFGDTRFPGTDTLRDDVYTAMWRPRVQVDDRFGDPTTTVGAEPLITSDWVRCELNAGGIDGPQVGVEGNVYTVTAYYETAGDYRF